MQELLNLPAEIHLEFFRKLGPAECDLDDAFCLALTCKTLYDIYKENRTTIASHIIAKSSVYSYDVLQCRVQDLEHNLMDRTSDARKNNLEPPFLTEQEVADCHASPHPTIEETHMIARRWQDSTVRDEYRHQMSDYRRSPFPYKWHLPSMSPVDSIEESSNSDASSQVENLALPVSFNNQFHKAQIRCWLAHTAFRIVTIASSNTDKNKYLDWAYKLWHGDRTSSFLEFIQALEVCDFGFGFTYWLKCSRNTREDHEELFNRMEFCLQCWQIRGQSGILAYPDVSDRRVPASFDGLLSKQGLSEEERSALVQAWFDFRGKWQQTGRCSVWNLQSSDDAYARLREWTEASAQRSASL